MGKWMIEAINEASALSNKNPGIRYFILTRKHCKPLVHSVEYKVRGGR